MRYLANLNKNHIDGLFLMLSIGSLILGIEDEAG